MPPLQSRISQQSSEGCCFAVENSQVLNMRKFDSCSTERRAVHNGWGGSLFTKATPFSANYRPTRASNGRYKWREQSATVAFPSVSPMVKQMLCCLRVDCRCVLEIAENLKCMHDGVGPTSYHELIASTCPIGYPSGRQLEIIPISYIMIFRMFIHYLNSLSLLYCSTVGIIAPSNAKFARNSPVSLS